MQHAKRLALILLACCLPFALAGCTAQTPPLATNAYDIPTYRLSAGDRLSIRIFGEDSLSKEYVITSAGDISFPLLGDVRAAGISSQELSKNITAMLSEGYLNDPRVSIEVLNFRPIYVLGEVQRSGEFSYKPELTATQAIALAGGYTYRAQKNRVFIRRADSDQELTYELSSGHPVYVAPGDTIRVGERFF